MWGVPEGIKALPAIDAAASQSAKDAANNLELLTMRISIDTNVLLRRLLQDDPVQSRKADSALAQHDDILITDVVLAETIWTLSGKRYAATRDDIANTILALLEDPSLRFESNNVIWSALNDFMEFEYSDFQDALIARKAGELGYPSLLSFDKDAQTLPNVRAP